MGSNNPQKELVELKKEVKEIKLVLERQHNHSVNVSPLPSAKDLKELEEISPGITERFMTIVESQVKHNQERDKETIAFDNKTLEAQQAENSLNASLKKRTQNFALIAIVVMLVAAAVFAALGMKGAAIASILAAVAPILIASVTSMIVHRSSKK